MLLKSFRLFVSSTFKDFAQERERLQTEVFPALDTYCAARGYQFHAVDMRWGVNEEAQLDQRTAELCLGEVAAAKGYPAPNFLVMIGDRYGWVPLPFAIAQDEFEAIVSWLGDRGDTGVVDDLLTAYELDHNTVVEPGLAGAAPKDESLVAAYTLRSREKELSAFAHADEWEKLEVWLRSALQMAANHLLQAGRIDANGHQKYFLSLTEQEIIRGVPRYNRGGVDDAPALLTRPEDVNPHAIAWIREPAAPSTAAAEPRLDPLKAALRRALPADAVVTGTAITGADGNFDQAYLAAFASTIENKLKAAIDERIAAASKEQAGTSSELLIERDEHRAFAEERRKAFVGREGSRAAIASYIGGAGAHPLVVYGRSGSGKSALMAVAVADAEKSTKAAIYRFIGASAASTDQRAMLISVVDDLAEQGVVTKPERWEDDGNKFAVQVRDLLTAIVTPVVIAIDALDQLSKPYRPNWLPDKLPAEMKIIVSVLDDAAFVADSGIYRSLRQRLPPEAFLEIEPLGAAHGHDILARLEQAARRRLQTAQREYVVHQFVKAGGSPLYLRIAFELARGWRSTEKVGPDGRELADSTTALIAQLIDELTTVHHHEPELVSRTLGYITAARDGLSAAELVEVLSRDAGVMQAISSERHGARTARLPVSVWVRLHNYLSALLVEKRVGGQPLLQFFHRQVAEVARERYHVNAKLALHGALASYYDAPTGTTVGSVSPEAGSGDYSTRSLAELPYQLFHAERRDRLDQILMGPDWMQQKLHAFGPQPLVGDYDDFGRGSMQGLIGRTLRLTTGILGRDRRQLFPQLLGRLKSNANPTARIFLDRVRGLIKPPTLLPASSTLAPPGAELVRIQGQIDGVEKLAVFPDGRLVSGEVDGTIRIWDPATGEEIVKIDALQDAGGWELANSLVVLPDGRVASGALDSRIRLWDAGTGELTAILEGHTGKVCTLVVLPDGRLASGSADTTIRVWDLATLTQTIKLDVHDAEVTSLTMLHDGRLASGSRDGTIKLWDDVPSKPLTSISSSWVTALAVLADGRLASGHYEEKRIVLWDPVTGLQTAELGGILYGVRALAGLPDGRLAASLAYDASVRLWNVDRFSEPGRLDGHASPAEALIALPNGRLASSSSDRSIRIWDVTAVDHQAGEWVGHSGLISALATLPDGRLASCSSADEAIKIWKPSDNLNAPEITISCRWVSAIVQLPDGRLASGSSDKTLQIWDTATGIESATMPVGSSFSWGALASVPDGLIVAAGQDMSASIIDPATGAETARLDGHNGGVTCLVALPNGRIACGAGDGTITVWDLATHTPILRIAGRRMVRSLAYLSNGLLAAGFVDTTLSLWNLTSGQEICRFNGHTRPVMALAGLSNDLLASASDDRTIRLWNVKSCNEVASLEIDAPVARLAFLPSNRASRAYLVAGDEIGRLHWLEFVE